MCFPRVQYGIEKHSKCIRITYLCTLTEFLIDFFGKQRPIETVVQPYDFCFFTDLSKLLCKTIFSYHLFSIISNCYFSLFCFDKIPAAVAILLRNLRTEHSTVFEELSAFNRTILLCLNCELKHNFTNGLIVLLLFLFYSIIGTNLDAIIGPNLHTDDRKSVRAESLKHLRRVEICQKIVNVIFHFQTYFALIDVPLLAIESSFL